MKFFFSLVFFLLSSLSSSAFAKCGDGVCGVGESVSICSLDCRPVKSMDQALTVGQGPAVRGVAFGDGIVLGRVTIADGQANLQVSFFDAKFQLRSTKTVLSRQLDGEGGLGNPQVLVDQGEGVIYLAFRDHLSESRPDRYRLRVVRSRDKGESWDYVSDDGVSGVIDQGSVGLWEPFLYRDASAALRVVYAKERDEKLCSKQRGDKQDIVMKVSRDGGRTWAGEAIVASDGISREGVPSVAQLRDGSYLMVFESWQNASCNRTNPALMIRSMASRDGVKWGERKAVFDPYQFRKGLKRIRATWPYVGVLPDGRAIVSFTSNHKNFSKPDRGGKGVAPEKDKSYDVYVMTSQGGARFTSLMWDLDSLLPAMNFDESSKDSNRYASLVVMRDGRVVVLSGLPQRFVVLR